ncbi:hypothetical protein J6590_020762 [Homalodisca vitripennis]|nr:hypothetical protein J6590_020762 [Homalodisca vitripennis]
MFKGNRKASGWDHRAYPSLDEDHNPELVYYDYDNLESLFAITMTEEKRSEVVSKVGSSLGKSQPSQQGLFVHSREGIIRLGSQECCEGLSAPGGDLEVGLSEVGMFCWSGRIQRSPVTRHSSLLPSEGVLNLFHSAVANGYIGLQPLSRNAELLTNTFLNDTGMEESRDDTWIPWNEWMELWNLKPKMRREVKERFFFEEGGFKHKDSSLFKRARADKRTPNTASFKKA